LITTSAMAAAIHGATNELRAALGR